MPRSPLRRYTPEHSPARRARSRGGYIEDDNDDSDWADRQARPRSGSRHAPVKAPAPSGGRPRLRSVDRQDSYYRDPRPHRPHPHFAEDDDVDDDIEAHPRRRSRTSQFSGNDRAVAEPRRRARSTESHYRRDSRGGSPRRRRSLSISSDSESDDGRTHRRRRSSRHSPDSHDQQRQRARSHYPPSSSRRLAEDTNTRRGRSVDTHTHRTLTHSRHQDRDGRSASTSKKDPASSSHHRNRSEMIMRAAQTAMETGAMAALKMRGDSSPWIGAKGAKVVATALGAAAVDTFVEQRHPVRKGGVRHSMMRQATQMALGSLVLKPVANKVSRHGRH
ncbi:hypothetical protein B0T22DRAFT_154830 [Podospora appendiculata]|uniref:Uncharacterized protein n=1 Tax=Podospora appendiculata TaxID=314037 RepID=A0AAE1CCG4_9PEZI|nr:hypothetical protein B0T22DRAFT_154830 [Podospora appendiculata]